MGRTACTEPQCLYKGALYLFFEEAFRGQFSDVCLPNFSREPVQNQTLDVIIKEKYSMFISAAP